MVHVFASRLFSGFNCSCLKRAVKKARPQLQARLTVQRYIYPPIRRGASTKGMSQLPNVQQVSYRNMHHIFILSTFLYIISNLRFTFPGKKDEFVENNL